MSNARRVGKERPGRRQPLNAVRPGTAQHTSPPAQEDAASKRRERKRVTDRVAQQEYRKRQKQHIEELQSKIDLLTSNCNSDQIATLLKENELLRSELQKMNAFFEGVRTLFGNVTPADSQTFSNDANDEVQNNKDEGAGVGVELSAPVREEAASSSTCTTFDIDQSPDRAAEIDADFEIYQHPDVYNVSPEFNNGTDLTFGLFKESMEPCAGGLNRPGQFTEQDADDDFQREQSMYSDSGFALSKLSSSFYPSLPISHMNKDCPWSDMVPLSSNSNVLDDPQEADEHQRSYRLGQFVMHDAFSDSLSASMTQTHLFTKKQCFLAPVRLEVASSADLALWSFLQRRESGVQVGSGSSVPGPSVMDFLVDNVHNPLSLKIKTYLKPITRLMQTSELLASYWIITLFTRWYMTKDPAHFREMPEWLRPTPLQMTVSYPLTLWFMPWPLLRDAAIGLTLSEPECSQEIMKSLGENMEVDLSGSSKPLEVDHFASSSIQSSYGNSQPLCDAPSSQQTHTATTNHSHDVGQAICNLNNWRLKDGFFLKYPAWKRIYQQSRDCQQQICPNS